MMDCSHFCGLSGFSLGLAAIHAPRDYMRARRFVTLSRHMGVFIPKAAMGNWRSVPLITAAVQRRELPPRLHHQLLFFATNSVMQTTCRRYTPAATPVSILKVLQRFCLELNSHSSVNNIARCGKFRQTRISNAAGPTSLSPSRAQQKFPSHHLT